MRNIFDQFKKPENRLTHALACTLYHDSDLFQSFLTEFLKIAPPSISRLKIIEQSLPDTDVLSHSIDKDFKAGLPDMIIYDDEEWCLIIESKISACICQDQLKRHLATLKRRGYNSSKMVLICIEKPSYLIENCMIHTWSSIFKWISSFCAKSKWAKELRDYFSILEKSMTDDGYLTAGTITDFVGIPFDKTTPFSYLEGKRILKILIQRLKERKNFDPQLGIDYSSGRGAIANHSTIWDVISLNSKENDKSFTDTSHFTFGFTEDNLQVMLTLPDSVLKRKLYSFETVEEELENLVLSLEGLNIDENLYSPRIKLDQRHYQHRRSEPVKDGLLEFDLRAITTLSANTHKIKKQKGWLEAVYALCKDKTSKMQGSVKLTV